MNLQIYLIGLAFIVEPGLAQRGVRQAPTPPKIQPPQTPATTSAPQPTVTEGVTNLDSKSGKNCTGPDLKAGFCAPLAQCSELIDRLKVNQRNETFAKFLRTSNEKCESQYSVVCCPSGVQVATPTVTFPENVDEIPRKLPTMADGCGFVKNVHRKIVGGAASKAGAWPWIALIGYEDNGLSTSPFKCGGALITSRHVLTAAHCIKTDLTFVRLGEHDLSRDDEVNHIDIPVVKTLRHPQYDKNDGHNDIALLYLDRNVKFSDKITPICIPFEPQFRSKNLIGLNPFVAGWGKTQEGGTSAKILQELQVPVYENSVCKDLYKKQNTYLSEKQFDNAIICAGDLGGGKDTCQGDSGGPLMFPEFYQRVFRFHLIGIVSYGIGCARPMVPGVYSRVANFIEWIEAGVADTQKSRRKSVENFVKKFQKLKNQCLKKKMNLQIYLIGLALIVVPGLAQRGVRQGQQCYTPENDIGQCLTLSYCPSIANVLNIYPRTDAERYLRIAKRNCGNNNFRGDPVVCCGVNQQFFTEPTTNTPRNPFFQQNTPQTTLPPIIIAPTPPRNQRPQTPATTSAPQPTVTEGVTNRDSKSGKDCTGPDLKAGFCAPLAQCPELIDRLKVNPRDETFARFLRISNEICESQYSVVCCPSGVQVTTPSVIFPRNVDEIPRKLPTMADGCGFVNNEYRKIVGGTASKVGAWPWIALIGYEDNGLSASPFKCGGALITSRHVLTAAHCIRADLTFVRLGEHDLSRDDEANHVDVPVVKTLRHPQYDRKDGHNDIALLYLSRNVQFSDKVTPICIPFEPQFRSKKLIGFNPFVAGWGKTQEGGTSAKILQELQIPIYENSVCKDLYKKQNTYLSEKQFDNAIICAGDLGGGKDTCQGDSGGPLMFPEDYQKTKRFHLIGIVSYGIGCARPMVPGVYSRVTNFIEWIEAGVADTP
ncbi:uncharacterized protein LOC129945223 [Eupeodes corollae]|uniref:uncharacterized protein LOC129945223 n=1 Tax=Eupeodes corollae TaxID=290404 RepID=UPI00248FAF3E|nr:uncharacterized protein LOC129945223 [Eupeodes corollae]